MLPLLLIACAKTPLSSLAVEDESGRATPAELEEARAAVRDFAAWTGREELRVRRVVFRDHESLAEAGFDSRGWLEGEVWLRPGVPDPHDKVLQYLCFVLGQHDDLAETAPIPPPSSFSYPAYRSRQDRAERFTARCANGPADEDLKPLLEPNSDSRARPWWAWSAEHVWKGAHPAVRVVGSVELGEIPSLGGVIPSDVSVIGGGVVEDAVWLHVAKSEGMTDARRHELVEFNAKTGAILGRLAFTDLLPGEAIASSMSAGGVWVSVARVGESSVAVIRWSLRGGAPARVPVRSTGRPKPRIVAMADRLLLTFEERDHGTRVEAVSLDDGSTLWSRMLPDGCDLRGRRSEALVDCNRMSEGVRYRLDSRTGSLRREPTWKSFIERPGPKGLRLLGAQSYHPFPVVVARPETGEVWRVEEPMKASFGRSWSFLADGVLVEVDPVRGRIHRWSWEPRPAP